MMNRDGWTGPIASSAMAFAWFVFWRDHNAPAIVDRISWKDSEFLQQQESPPDDSGQ